MELLPIKSPRIEKGDDLLSFLESTFQEGDVLAIASKVVAYSEGRLVSDEESLVEKEADKIFEGGEMTITLKNKILIPNAGIDHSNTPEGKAVLWPEDPFASARTLRKRLIEKHNLQHFGVLITDSHCQPLRKGTVGMAIGWAGFEGVIDERGKDDLFGKPMHYTQMAVADGLASAANILMGETDAQIPFVIVRGVEAEFTDREFSSDDYYIPPEKCIYKGIYKSSIFS